MEVWNNNDSSFLPLGGRYSTILRTNTFCIMTSFLSDVVIPIYCSQCFGSGSVSDDMDPDSGSAKNLPKP